MPSRILVIYYSRSGNTKKVAQEIAGALGADLEAIADPADRSGLLGYLRSGFEAYFRTLAEIGPAHRDPQAYDLVIIGTPIWDMSLSSPVRSYLHRYQDRLPAVAFFCTCGGSGGERTFGHMARVAGKKPVATLAVRAAEVDRASSAVAKFLGEVRDAVAVAGPRPAPTPVPPPPA